jgi:hypothetical protein
MTDSIMPNVDAYLAGKGDLEVAAAELIRLMPLHGTLLGSEDDHSPEVIERARILEARTRVLLAELRRAAHDRPEHA